MVRNLAVFIVGHSDWGKATVLKELTGGNGRAKEWNIARRTFRIKRRSNDDLPKPPYETTLQYVNRADLDSSLILAFAPNFTDPRCDTQAILETLKRKKYELRFFVLKNQQSKQGACPISDEELSILQNYGTGMTLDGYDEPKNIAESFLRYVASVVSSMKVPKHKDYGFTPQS